MKDKKYTFDNSLSGTNTPDEEKMAKKAIKVWVAKNLRGAERTEERLTLKSLCLVIGVSYNTAKKRQDTEGGVTIWTEGDDQAWEVWVKVVEP
jgi:hypothetical protein